MKRAPIIIAGTIAGLVGVLEFHTSPATLGASGLQSAAAAPAAARPAGGSGNGRAGAAAQSSPGSASGRAAGAGRSAAGSQVNYNFGVISVRVTVSGRKIVKVGIASLNDGSNPTSQYIDGQAIPILEREVMQAQSANIQGVSGASFTSEGFYQSLQSALHSLGFS